MQMPQEEPSKPQETWVEPEFKSYPGDEIPGYTGFIYRLNRPRRPEEYVGYWREQEKTQAKVAEIMKGLDLDPNWSQEDLLSIMVNLNKKVEDLEAREEGWRKDIQDAHDVKYQLQTKLDEINKQVQKIEDAKVKEITAKTVAMKQVLKFGGHEQDCAYAEASACGRMLRGSEEKICNCGWYEVQKAIKESLKS
jgi:hypothetical protein